MLVDIHGHASPKKNQCTFVVGVHSLGIHPWELRNPFEEKLCLKKFNQLQSHYNNKILAIGECGLDRRRKDIASISDQEKVLLWHMDWAQAVGRPLILHCVHAYSDLLKLLKQKKYTGKILLHDFAGNLGEAKSFLLYDCYFSFGKRLFSLDQKAASIFCSLPRNRIFLETDDQKEYLIEDLYQKGNELLKLSLEDCEKLFEENLVSFFSDLYDVSSADVINDLSACSFS